MFISSSIASTFYQIQNQPNLESESETQFNDEPEGDRVSSPPSKTRRLQIVVELFLVELRRATLLERLVEQKSKDHRIHTSDDYQL